MTRITSICASTVSWPGGRAKVTTCIWRFEQHFEESGPRVRVHYHSLCINQSPPLVRPQRRLQHFRLVTRFTARSFPSTKIWSGLLYKPAFQAAGPSDFPRIRLQSRSEQSQHLVEKAHRLPDSLLLLSTENRCPGHRHASQEREEIARQLEKLLLQIALARLEHLQDPHPNQRD